MTWSAPSYAFALVLVGVACTVEYTATEMQEGDGDSGGDGVHCDEPEIACDDACVDPLWDDANCGACGVDCEDGSGCVGGVCLGICELGCDPDRQVCEGGLCRCRDGLTNCAGLCVNLSNDPDHCGDCWAQCDEVCGDGSCGEHECEGFPNQCGDSCTNVDADPLNCGECDSPCPSETLCVFGACEPYEIFDPEMSEPSSCPEYCLENQALCCESSFIGLEVCINTEECPPS